MAVCAEDTTVAGWILLSIHEQEALSLRVVVGDNGGEV